MALKNNNYKDLLRSCDSSFKEVCESLNRIIDKFQKSRLEKEQQFQYLQAVIQQTGMGLISVKTNGDVNLINKSARNMLQLPYLRHVKQLEASNKRQDKL